jgi:hypothetical protein
MLGENPNDYSTGIPAEDVFYQDLVGQPFAARDLRSLKLGSSGKPDCLIRRADGACVRSRILKKLYTKAATSPQHSAFHSCNTDPQPLCNILRCISVQVFKNESRSQAVR